MKLITTNAAKIIGKIFFLTILTQNCYAMADKASTKISSQTIKEGDKITSEDNLDQGRDFNVLSFNADGSELMFNECFDAKLINKDAKEGEKECGVFRLNMTTKALRRYEFPDQDEYFYSDASFSPKGDYVVMKRAPKVDGSLPDEEYNSLIRQSAEQSEICFMRADGSGFKVIKTTPGVKARPVMSNDETKIAYYRGSLRKPGSKTFAANFDIWEIDLKNKTDKLFAGPYEFYGVGPNMQYLRGDQEIIAHLDGPKYGRGGLSVREYSDKYSNSFIYVIKRGKVELLEPVTFDGMENQRYPFIAKSGDMFFYGQGVKGEVYGIGLGLFKRSSDGKIVKWDDDKFGSKFQLLSNPEEKKIFFVSLVNDGNPFRRNNLTKKSIAIFNLKFSEWQKLNIPQISSNYSIHVSAPNEIEIKSPDNLDNSLKKLPNFSLTNPIKNK